VNHLDRVATNESIAPLGDIGLVNWPISHMHEDATEGLIVVTTLNNVDTINSALAHDGLEDLLDPTPVGVLVAKGTRNADGRGSDNRVVGRHFCL
tara:strand:- start:1099 stop:1383 length:285 start_codon:yes stop_codon:yes gene_type:complete